MSSGFHVDGRRWVLLVVVSSAHPTRRLEWYFARIHHDGRALTVTLKVVDWVTGATGSLEAPHPRFCSAA